MICYRRKSSVRLENQFFKKNTQKRPFWVARNWHHLTLRVTTWASWELFPLESPVTLLDVQRRKLTVELKNCPGSSPGQLLGYPWQLCGITVQTSYVDGWWHQNWVRSRPTKIFASDNGNSWKLEIFTLRPPARKRREILWWAIKDKKTGMHRGTNAFWTKSGSGPFLTVFCLSEVGRCR